jgi:hypothetical protein
MPIRKQSFITGCGQRFIVQHDFLLRSIAVRAVSVALLIPHQVKRRDATVPPAKGIQ